jgi:hypothetical protein
MVITVPLQSPTAMPNLGLKNVTGFGTKTDPPVEATLAGGQARAV